MKGHLLVLVSIAMSLWMTDSLTLRAQSVQPGRVLEYQGTAPKTPLSEVSIAAKDASATLSEEDGAFTLQFRTLHAGSDIQMRRIEKAGYEVMNQEAVEQFRVGGKKSRPIQVVMCSKAKLQQLRSNYRSVATQRYEQQLHLSEAEAERLRKEGKLKEEEYNARLDSLEEEYEDKLSKLESYIDKFARIDLSEVDAYEQQIVSLVQGGKFDDAIALYDQQDFPSKIKQSREALQKLANMKSTIAETYLAQTEQNQRLRQSIDRQVILLYMAGGIQNLEKAHHILQETFLADTTHVDARREYALSLKTLGQIEESLSVLMIGEKNEKDSYSRGLLMGEIMRTLWRLDRADEAYRYAMAMDSLMSPLAEDNYRVLTRALPAWSEIQLNYHLLHENFDLGKSVAVRVEENWSPDTLNHKSVKSYLFLLTALNDFYSQIADRKQSLWCAQEMIRLGEIAQRLDPCFNEMGTIYASVASTYSLECMKDELLQSSRQCVAWLEKRIEKKHTKTILEESAVNYYQLIDALVLADEFALSDSIVNTEMYQKSVEKSKESNNGYIKLYLGLLQLHEARIKLENKDIKQADVLSKAALAAIGLEEDGAELVPVLQAENDSRIAFYSKNYKEAEIYCKKAIVLSEEAYKDSQDSWDADRLCRNYLLMAEIHLASGKKAKATKYVDMATSVAAFPCNHQSIENLKKLLR